MKDCLFCNIANNTVESIRVYEDDVVFVMMDIFPESKGHLLIIPRQHADNLSECTDDTLKHIIIISKKIAAAAQVAFRSDGIKIAQFNGKAAGQTVFHYHMHVIPTYDGVAFKRHSAKPEDGETLKELAQKIKEHVS